MAAKLIQVSDDAGANWHTLPGGEGTLNREAGSINDTIFGQTFQSNEVGLINWSISAQSFYKGFAGYIADLKEIGTTTAMTTEAMTLISGKTYDIDDASKSVWDKDVTLVVFDNAVDETANVESVNFLFGEVTFKAAHTVTGPVTVTGSYFPTAVLGKATSFTLTQTADGVETSTFDTMQTNSGLRTFDPGLRLVGLEMGGVYALASGFGAALQARSEMLIEINPDGAGLSVARGYFKLSGQGQSGAVGALEEETISASLVVPQTPALLSTPFAWKHDSTTTLHLSLQKILTAWQDETKLDAQYLDDGVVGDTGQVVITEVTMSSGLDAMNEFSITMQGDGALTAV